MKNRIRVGAARKIACWILFALANLAAPFLVHAADDADKPDLKKLRADYQTAREQAAKAVQPDFKDPQFKQKATAWIDALDAKSRTARHLAKGLFVTWIAAADPTDSAPLEQELSGIYRELTAPPISEKKHEECVFFSHLVMEIVAQPDLSQKRAAYLATLTAPHQGIRDNDRQIKQGKPTEPWGWEIQDAYSLALARAGQFKQARDENDLLQAKIDILLRINALPALAENQKKTRRGFLVHRVLIETLAGNADAARKLVIDVSAMADLGILDLDDAALLDEAQKRLETK